jgi:glycosyltransferase involved in cell wall biosynthesis
MSRFPKSSLAGNLRRFFQRGEEENPCAMSVCIPTYEMRGEGARFARRAIESVLAQTFTDYETIVSDQSMDDKVAEVCAEFPQVRYFRFRQKKGNASANVNNALDQARGKYIKILFQDDVLSGPDALGRIMGAIDGKAWLLHSYWHTDLSGRERRDPTQPSIPYKQEKLITHNPIGAPTCLAMRKNNLRFDENLIWFMDCEFYYRLLRKFGAPVILQEQLAVQTVWPGQLTQTVSEPIKKRERDYLRNFVRRARFRRWLQDSFQK